MRSIKFGADGYACSVYVKGERAPYGYKYVYIIVNSNGSLLLARKHDSVTFEAPGGHIETGEKLEIAACRELYEETGLIIPAEQIRHVFDYHAQTQKNMAGANTAVFFVDISDREIPMPPVQFEMAETRLFHELPPVCKLSYPTIAKTVYDHYKKMKNDSYTNQERSMT